MRLTPNPPTPDIIGSTTFSVAATATAASKALPPASRISSPACVANGCAELIIPCLPTAGREVVLRLVGLSWPAQPRIEQFVGSLAHLGRKVVATVGMLDAQPLLKAVQLEDGPGGGDDPVH